MGFDYKPRQGFSQYRAMSYDAGVHATPEPAISHAPQPGGSLHHTTAFNPEMKPANAAAGREYIKQLIEGVQLGQINPDKIDFTRINLHGADLKGLNVKAIGSKALSQIDFAGTDLSGQTFTGDMRGFHAPGAKLHGTVFEGARMQESNLEGAKCLNTTFSGGTTAAGANLTHMTGSVKMHNADFAGAAFSGSTLSGTAHNVNFEAIHARKFNMAALHISGPKTSFKNAELDEVTMNPQQYKMLKAPAAGVKSLTSPHIVEPGHANAQAIGAIASAPSPFGGGMA